MKRTLSLILALCLMLTAFTGIADEKETIELRFYDINSTAERTAFFEKIFEEYYQETGYRFTYSGEPWANSTNSVMTMLAGGNGPDLFVSQPNLPVFVNNGWVLPIDEWIEAHGDEYVTLVTDYYWANAKEAFGHNYWFPDATNSRGIYYRKDWVKELGIEIPTGKDWNWDAFWDLAAKLTDPEKNRYGFAFRGGKGCEAWCENYLQAYTGTYIYNPETLKFMTDEYRVGMKAYTDSYVNGLAPADSLNWGWAEQIDGFCSGLIGLFFNDSDAFPQIMSKMEEGTWGVLPIPYNNDGTGIPTNINATYSYAINAATKYPEACFGLIEMLNRPENNAAYCIMMGEIPVRVDVVDTPYFSEEGPLGEFVKNVNNLDALLGGQLINVNQVEWAGYTYDFAGELQMYLLGETTFDEFFEGYNEFHSTAIDNYFAANPDAGTDVYRLRDIVEAK